MLSETVNERLGSSWHYGHEVYGRPHAKEKEEEMPWIMKDQLECGPPNAAKLRERLGWQVDCKQVERLLHNNGWGQFLVAENVSRSRFSACNFVGRHRFASSKSMRRRR